jgi:ribonucleotide reductase beta subunit family protein with ferritin-like domain
VGSSNDDEEEEDDYDDSGEAHLYRALLKIDARGDTFDAGKISGGLFSGKTEIYKRFSEVQLVMTWAPRSMPLYKDIESLALNPPELTPELRQVVENTLVFFAAADIQVVQNISDNYSKEITQLEMFNEEEKSDAGVFLSAQELIEKVHGISYDQMLSVFKRDRSARKRAIDNVVKHPAMSYKYQWVNRWMNKKIPIGYRMFASVLTEGIFFSGSFALIGLIRDMYPSLLPGICVGNKWIFRDENVHQRFYTYCVVRYREWLRRSGEDEDLDEGIMLEMVHQALEAEIQFYIEGLVNKDEPIYDGQGILIGKKDIEECSALGIPGLTVKLMYQYIKYLCDNILESVGMSKVFKVQNSLPHTLKMASEVQESFFEQATITTYQKEYDDMSEDEEEDKTSIATTSKPLEKLSAMDKLKLRAAQRLAPVPLN